MADPPAASDTPMPSEGRRRAQIEHVQPQIDGGRFPIKRIAGDRLVVQSDIFADGHDRLSAVILHRPSGTPDWSEAPMELLGNDRWRGSFPLGAPGVYEYTILAWVDSFLTWVTDLGKWLEVEADVSLQLLEGALVVGEAAERAAGPDADRLHDWARKLRGWAEDGTGAKEPARLKGDAGPLASELSLLMSRYPDRRFATRYCPDLSVVVERERAAFSSWYEFFPRSTASEPGRHGTFHDAQRILPYVEEMGFDVIYLPPIHPVGTTHRKGPNNRTTSESGDPGSPWAIGSEEGGHTSVHPELGTLEDFRSFREGAEARGMEVALDIAFQCSPDHPWVEAHPEWFRTRPDGSIRHAENPPKKYEDIFPLDFETEDWAGLWEALRDVFLFWMEQGVRIFRVDNPHTKALPFWEWVITELKGRDAGVILLSEAFTRPRMMYRLAKLGFTQSYTYFAWRNTKAELTSYMEELVGTEASEFFRPNFWPNTPDILTEFLQTGERSAFMVRLVLAATLSSNYGIYGPPFELMEHTPREPGSEEYLDSEKYQLRDWQLDRPDSLHSFIARVNRIRSDHPALQRNASLRFHHVDNDKLLVWSKRDPRGEDRIVVVVNLDPHHTQSGWVRLDPGPLGLAEGDTYQVHDLLAGGRYLWDAGPNYVELNPAVSPAHIFRLLQRTRDEEDFEYF